VVANSSSCRRDQSSGGAASDELLDELPLAERDAQVGQHAPAHQDADALAVDQGAVAVEHDQLGHAAVQYSTLNM
jgi:hypothetical protein